MYAPSCFGSEKAMTLTISLVLPAAMITSCPREITSVTSRQRITRRLKNPPEDAPDGSILNTIPETPVSVTLIEKVRISIHIIHVKNTTPIKPINIAFQAEPSNGVPADAALSAGSPKNTMHATKPNPQMSIMTNFAGADARKTKELLSTIEGMAHTLLSCNRNAAAH
jgi:hypothetical protein